MGYNVSYRHSLWLDDPTPDLVLSYDRGDYGWDGETPPPDHPGEGLQDNNSGEYLIFIKDNKVRMKLQSEKFYVHYMTRLLKLLKTRYPSLRGYVSSDMERYWTVTDAVAIWTVLSVHDVAKNQYEASSSVQTSRKRAHAAEEGEDLPAPP